MALDPLLWVLGLLAVSVGWPALRPAVRRRWAAAALLLLTLLGMGALPQAGLRWLEQQYPEIAPDAPLAGYAGVVVLGGATESGAQALAYRQPGLNGGAERMTAAVALARRYPQLPLVFTGGEGKLGGVGPSEAERARRFFVSQGLPDAQLRYEDVSRNTYENAVLTARLPGVDPQQRWLLVTSAWHMPRAMATFRKAGWNVQAYPVDFRTTPEGDGWGFSLAGGADAWGLLLREAVGLLVYRLTDRL